MLTKFIYMAIMIHQILDIPLDTPYSISLQYMYVLVVCVWHAKGQGALGNFFSLAS